MKVHIGLFLLLLVCPAFASQPDTHNTSNPFIAYSSLLLQWDYLNKLGPVNHYLTLNIQPSVPFHLNQQVDLLLYSDLPVNSEMKMIYTNAPAMQLGDYQQFLFFSPANTGNLYFGVGPIFSFPTATTSVLASEKWGIGPALQAAYFGEKVAYGVIGYYLCSYAGNPNRPNISRTYWNPWLTYNLDTFNNVGIQSEPYVNFMTGQVQIPLEAYYNHFILLNNDPVKFTFDGLYWPVAPNYFPSWSLRFNITLMVPRKY
ncbi:MAG: hypothetical protein QME05_03045 [Candidatus Margulisbacteria bacterium]|nr:hypothetical protein [Candidatus Margulisiibacteriota bacterium]